MARIKPQALLMQIKKKKVPSRIGLTKIIFFSLIVLSSFIACSLVSDISLAGQSVREIRDTTPVASANLLSRTLGLLKKNCQSTLAVDSVAAAEGSAFMDTVETSVEKARIHYENLSLSSACEAILEIGNAGNLYMDERHHGLFSNKGVLLHEALPRFYILQLNRLLQKGFVSWLIL